MAGALVVREGRLLLARRGPAEKHAGDWELPGGKLEAGESPEEALLRELAEELGVSARVVGPARRYDATLGSRRFAFYVLSAAFEGEPAFLAVHDRIAWIGPGDLGDYRLAPLDGPALADWAAGS